MKLSDEQLRTVARLSEQLKNKQIEYARIEVELKGCAERIREIEMIELPDMLTELGLESLTLLDGSKISVQAVVSASITKANEDAAHAWLKDNGYGDIIKERTVCNVHPSTLKAWARERLENGDNVPDDLFSLWRGQRAVVK